MKYIFRIRNIQIQLLIAPILWWTGGDEMSMRLELRGRSWIELASVQNIIGLDSCHSYSVIIVIVVDE